jgi:hypothetical protein
MDSNFYQKQRDEQDLAGVSDSEQTSAPTEFATAETAIQYDRDQTPAPPEIAERLNQSLANEPKRGASFWTRLGFRK